MAPSKESETTLLNAAAPTSPAAKSPTEASGRLQTVALEIPVTINGARTVVGSDKREPFSESTQTVLVFAQGAVVRVATPLAPGQLVFLTNEKTKKEVVCQVVKSKSSGTANIYIELQFTEAAPAFWGLRVPTTTSPVSTVAKPASPLAPQVTVPVKPAATVPVVAAKPDIAAPKVSAPQPPAPAVVFPPKPVAPPAPVAASPVASVSVPPPSSISSAPEPASASSEHANPPAKHEPTVPLPPAHNYTKDIEALFSSGGTSHQPAAPSPSEQLKEQASRLQAQLSSLVFSDTPAAASSLPGKPEPAANTIANKVLEIAREDKSANVSERKLAIFPERKPASSTQSAEEQEVKMPAWLAPLSQTSEATEAETGHNARATETGFGAVETLEASEAGAPNRPEIAVFGGQLLGESSPENAASERSGGKGVWMGIAAAVLALAAASTWYLRPSLFGASTAQSIKPENHASASASVSAPTPAVEQKTPAPRENVFATSSTPAPSTPPAKKPETASVVPPAVTHEREAKNYLNDIRVPATTPPPAAVLPAEEKSGLGNVRLAAPVVNRGSKSSQNGDALPSIDTNTAAGTEPLSEIVSPRGDQPSAPLVVGGDVKSAVLISSVPPVYPPMARSQHISGTVQLDALIDASGSVANVKVLSGPPLLYRAAQDAVKQWKYKPALLDGQPTSMHLTVVVQFKAQ